MKKVLLSAFTCNPYKGSESANGWNWSVGIVREGFAVHTLTRGINKEDIEKHPPIENLTFHFISLPLGLEKLYAFSQATMYIYYILWQWVAYRFARKLKEKHTFHRVQHVTWGSIQLGSFLYKLKIPFIFGPAGGGQKAPSLYKNYFSKYWATEEKREKVSNILVRYNPACKKMLQKADIVLVSNTDTYQLAKKAGANNIHSTLDAALPSSFFPEGFISRQPSAGQLKLLWIGRFMPRKGLNLVLEVMNLLKPYQGITLTIVGDGEMRKELEELYSAFELQNTVTFTGTVPYDQVRNYYSNHEAFFFTSLRDSCPMQLIEAMAFSLPIITIDLHGQREIVTEKTGMKVKMDAPKKVSETLAKAILDLSNDTTRYQSMSEAAYQFACDQNWDKKIKTIVSEFY